LARVENASVPAVPISARRRVGGADVLLLAVAVVAAASSWSTTGRFFNLIAVGVGAVAIVAALARLGVGWPRPWSVLTVLVLGAVTQAAKPPTGNITKSWFYPIGIGLGLVAVATLMLAVIHPRWRVRFSVAAGGMLVLATLATVAGGRRPRIDVWVIFQQSAAGLFHGLNPYERTFVGVPHGQTADCFNYLPATLLPTWLGWLSLDDVRYAETAIMIAGWLALAAVIARRASGEARGNGLLLLGVAMTLTGTLRVAQQAWNESMLLGYLLIAAALLVSGRRNWVVLPLALALATKQHMFLLLPLLVAWPMIGWRRTAYSVAGAAALSAPWVFWDFGRFKTCTVSFFLDIKPRFDSISLWQFVPSGLRAVAVLACVVGAYVLVWQTVARTEAGLLLASGVVLFGFDVVNKQTFENQWWLVGELIICGLALRAVHSEAGIAARMESSR
jgi:hypothetical protein